VVVLSGQTLFAEGIAASLRRNMENQAFRTLDTQEPEVIEHLVASRPSVVIMDATDEAIRRHCPLDSLLDALPALTVLRVDPQRGLLHVVTSRQRSVRSMSEIVGVIHALATKEAKA
jgi:hypothetical protein